MQTLKKYKVHLKSISPLVTNCDTLANPLHPKTKEVKALTSLKKKTDEHHLAINRLQWESSLYYDENIGVYLPSENLRACIRASARKDKKGLTTKGLIIDSLPGPVLMGYEGMTPDKLWAIKDKKGGRVHEYIRSVVVQRAKQMRSRPIFPQWQVKFEVYLDVLILPEADLRFYIERAGFEYGVGELRPELATGTFGRFELMEMKQV